MKAVALFLGLSILFFTFCGTRADETNILATISVNPGSYERSDTPLSISLDDITSVNEENLRLYELIENELVFQAVQFSFGEERFLHWLLDGQTEPGKTRIFELRKESALKVSKNISVKREEDAYVILSGDIPVLQYNSGIVYPPEGYDTIYRRSGFIHPLFAPNGAVLTNIQPEDHMHHYGIWNPWTKTTFRGEEIDFWNLAKGEGRVRFGGVASVNQGPLFGSLQVLHEHVAWPDSPGEMIAMNELKEIRVFNRNENTFLIDIKSRLSPVEKLILEEYRYGGFVLRATDYWTSENSDFFTSEGLDRDHADGERARWCIVFGDTPEGEAGILMMGHPSNYNHPEPLRTWGSDATGGRGDHFINFSPTRNTQWILDSDRNYMLRYRILVFDGEMDTIEAERIWNDFSHPPVITVEE